MSGANDRASESIPASRFQEVLNYILSDYLTFGSGVASIWCWRCHSLFGKDSSEKKSLGKGTSYLSTPTRFKMLSNQVIVLACRNESYLGKGLHISRLRPGSNAF